MISTDIRIYHEKDFRVCFRWMLMCMCHLTWISIFPRDTKGVLSSVRNKQPMKKSPWSFLKNWGADRAHTDWANKRKHGKHTHTHTFSNSLSGKMLEKTRKISDFNHVFTLTHTAGLELLSATLMFLLITIKYLFISNNFSSVILLKIVLALLLYLSIIIFIHFSFYILFI